MISRLVNAIYACAVLATLGPALTGAALAQPQRRGLPAPQEVALPPTPVGVPMHRHEQLPVIEATINGQGPYRLVVDSGASGVVLASDHADTLDLPSPPGMPAGRVNVQVRTPSGPAAATLAYIDELRIGEARVRGIWTIATDLPFGEGIDGVIATSVFRSGLLTFDYPNGRVVLSHGELPAVNDQDVFSYRSQSAGSHPIIEMTVGGKAVEFVVDTGFRGWFGVPEPRAREMGVTAGPVVGRMALTAGGSMQQKIARVGDPIALGRYSVHDPVVHVQAEDTASSLAAQNIVGTLFLEHFVVTFDGTNNRIRLADGPDEPITPPAVRYLGLSLKQDGQQLEIWAVHPDSNARALGLLSGDRIHAFNGRPAVELYRSPEWRQLIRTTDALTVTYAPGGTGPTRDVDLQVLELLPDASTD